MSSGHRAIEAREVADPLDRRAKAVVPARHDLDAGRLEPGPLAGMQAVGDRRDRLAIARGAEGREELAAESVVVIPVEGGQDPRGVLRHREPEGVGVGVFGCDEIGFPLDPTTRWVVRPGRVRAVPGPGAREIADPVAVAAQVMAAAEALAPAGSPAERQGRQPFTTEERRGHPDVPGVIPVLPAPRHLAGAVGPHRGEAGPIPQRVDQSGDASRPQHDVVVEAHHPGCRPHRLALVPRADDRRPAVGVVRPRRADDAMHAEPHPVLGLDASPHVLPRRRQVAAEEEQVNVHQTPPLGRRGGGAGV